MTAKLTRGDGPRQWQSYRSSDTSPSMVFWSCPFCTLISTLDGGSVTADGMVTPVVTCITPLCGMTYRLYLEGWSGARIEPPAAFSSFRPYGAGN